MELIKNKGVGKKAINGLSWCSKCNNRGKIKIVQACDQEKFDREFDRLADVGTLPMNICYDRAMSGCKFDYHYCPDCEEGQKYKNEYPFYDGI